MNAITQPKKKELVEKIEALRQQVEDWRRTRDGNEHLPEPLWAAATELAKVYGVSPVQRILRIDYRGLERRALGIRKPHSQPLRPLRQRGNGHRSRTVLSGFGFHPRLLAWLACRAD
jgi:hypothetical protein